MKKRLCIYTIVCWAFTCSLYSAQPDTTHLKNEFKISITKFFINTFGIEYERLFNNATGLVVQGDGILTTEADNEIIGYQAGLQYRIYSVGEPVDLFKGSVEKLYMGPYASYRYVTISPLEETGSSSEIHSSNTGILLGLKITVMEKLIFDFSLGGGVQYSNGNYDEDNYLGYDVYLPGYSGIKPRANIAIGLKF